VSVIDFEIIQAFKNRWWLSVPPASLLRIHSIYSVYSCLPCDCDN